ncbi:hypothetical protein EDD21DRAFT_444136 [Dissophora ornata]|nr:hypothetical protein EDD21DRAFT_444136 [Dissophora ornata]
MTFFKSSKNQSASTATSPAATPRSSMHEQHPANTMTLDQALLMLHKKAMPNAASVCNLHERIFAAYTLHWDPKDSEMPDYAHRYRRICFFLVLATLDL